MNSLKFALFTTVFATVFARFMKNRLYKKLNKLISSVILGLLISEFSTIAEELPIHSLPVKKKTDTTSQIQIKNLLPFPIGNVDAASKKVEFDRNPFLEPSITELPITSNLNSLISFKGLVKSDEKLMAIISDNKEQKFYEVGDILSNGFIIKSISLKDVSIDIYNGSKNYRITLNNIKNKL